MSNIVLEFGDEEVAGKVQDKFVSHLITFTRCVILGNEPFIKVQGSMLS